jgi:stage II sporulation protein R
MFLAFSVKNTGKYKKERFMKHRFTPFITLLLCTLVLIILPTEAEAKIYENTVRLHILANSDSDEDQNLKLRIRDDILLTYKDILKVEPNGNLRIFEEYTDEIEMYVNARLSEYGAPYRAHVTFREEWYDTREYEEFTLPCGTYLSLVVHLGEGEGKNWWCVMYPPLCLDLATDAPRDDAFLGYGEGEVNLIQKGKYNVKFKALELFSSLLKN